jgi:hypothetical protein
LVEKLIFSGNHVLSESAVGAVYEDIQIDVVLPGSQETAEASGKNRMKLEGVMRYVASRRQQLISSRPELATHVRKLVFKHPPASTQHSFAPVEASVRESERIQAWNLAAILLEKCKGVRAFDWQLCYGIQGEVWTVSRALVTKLTIGVSVRRAHASLEDSVSCAGPISQHHRCLLSATFARTSSSTPYL